MATERGLCRDDLIGWGARELIQKAIEAELGELLSRYGKEITLGGQRAIVLNGYLPEREVLTAVWPVSLHAAPIASSLLTAALNGQSSLDTAFSWIFPIDWNRYQC